MIFFRTPDFWYREPNFFQKVILKPIASLYSFIATKNYFEEYKYISQKSKVIAIGGLTMGGSGKTIVVKSICDILNSKNQKTAILSRGFGRSSSETMLVDSKIHSYRDVGDEPLLLSKSVPVFVGKDRSKSAKLAEFTEDFDYLILDDGITQKYLKPDVKLVVIDNEQRLGNGEMFPLGPNRLDFQKIKSDIDGIIILNRAGATSSTDSISISTLNSSSTSTSTSTIITNEDIPIFRGETHLDFSSITNEKIILFCGLGYPNKFFNSVSDFSNFSVVEKIAFPDHYPFSDNDMKELLAKADRHKAQLVTTEKDFMRIPEKYKKNAAGDIANGNSDGDGNGNVIATVSINIKWDTPPLFFTTS
jgi:tetraacyldisaccharide 4'-kinase